VGPLVAAFNWIGRVLVILLALPLPLFYGHNHRALKVIGTGLWNPIPTMD
jgi:hypothetical protein